MRSITPKRRKADVSSECVIATAAACPDRLSPLDHPHAQKELRYSLAGPLRSHARQTSLDSQMRAISQVQEHVVDGGFVRRAFAHSLIDPDGATPIRSFSRSN